MAYPEVRVDTAAAATDSGIRLTLRCDGFARGVCLGLNDAEGFFSDNYFDLMPGQPVSVEVRTDLTPGEFVRLLTIKTLRDAY